MLPRLGLDERAGLLGGPGFFVGALAGEGVKHIGNRHDACCQRNGLAHQALGVATAVPFFVVAQRHFMRQGQHAATVRANDFSADFRVAAHHVPFLGRELAGLLQDGVGNANFAHVVHGRGVQQVVRPLRMAARRQCQQAGKVAHADDVHAGFVVFVFGGAAQALHDLQACGRQLVHAHEREVGFHARTHHGGAEGLGDVVHAAHVETMGFVGHIVQGGDENHRNGARGGIGLERAAHGVAVHAGHHHVEQDQFGLLLARNLQRARAIGGKQQAVVGTQNLAQHL